MELALFVYLAGMMESLKGALGILIFFSLAYGIFYSLEWSENLRYSQDTTTSHYSKAWMKWFVGLIFAIALLPSERTAYTVAGAYAVQKMVEHPSTQEVGGRVVDIINMKLDKYLDSAKSP